MINCCRYNLSILLYVYWLDCLRKGDSMFNGVKSVISPTRRPQRCCLNALNITLHPAFMSWCFVLVCSSSPILLQLTTSLQPPKHTHTQTQASIPQNQLRWNDRGSYNRKTLINLATSVNRIINRDLAREGGSFSAAHILDNAHTQFIFVAFRDKM